MSLRSRSTISLLARFAILLVFGANWVRAQISPAEILNPRLKALEQAYLKQLVAANQSIAKMEFPFTFYLSRYAGLDPKDQAAADRRGLEFVKFHESLVLKATGNYNAAYNGDLLTQNQRASRVFDEIVAPVLAQLTDRLAPGEGFDAFGLEIAYHVTTKTRNYQYEGRELLTIVMNKDDAINFKHLQGASRQEVLNRSEVYLDGKPLGLVLGERDPMPVEALERSTGKRNLNGAGSQSKGFEAQSPISVEESTAVTADRDLLAKMRDYRPLWNRGAVGTEADGSPRLGNVRANSRAGASPAPTKVDVDTLQDKYQSRLDEILKQAKAYNLVEYAPPAFVIYRNRLYLQLTLRNPAAFDQDATSIYKRAAQSLDLFLALHLKPIIEKLSDGADFAGLDVTVLDDLVSKGSHSSEAMEYILPIAGTRQFVAAEITNQDLISQSIVLANGVRIALNLQRVE